MKVTTKTYVSPIVCLDMRGTDPIESVKNACVLIDTLAVLTERKITTCEEAVEFFHLTDFINESNHVKHLEFKYRSN